MGLVAVRHRIRGKTKPAGGRRERPFAGFRVGPHVFRVAAHAVGVDGGVWESNPPGSGLYQPHNGFEGRAHHQVRDTSPYLPMLAPSLKRG